jgi:P4 family phage/plasmid primase-like protien
MSANEHRRYGADPTSWRHFEQMGLQNFLWPVVANPDAPISPDSTVTDRGKVPSLYNRRREIVGIPKWTTKQGTAKARARWMMEPDYGLCISTHLVRGLDFDVEDPAIAAEIRAAIERHFGILPLRSREDSSRFLAAITLQGDYKKRQIVFGEHKIEFLATGQHFVADSTHPKGKRYVWEGGLPDLFPRIAPHAFEAFWSELQASYAPEAPALTRARPVSNDCGAVAPDEADDGTAFEFMDEEVIRDLRAALCHLDHHNRKTWVDVGFALKSLGENGFALFEEFSKRSPKVYNEVDLRGRWNDFKPDTVDYRHIFTLAKDAGWVNPQSRVAKNSSSSAAIKAMHLCTDLKNAERVCATYGARLMVVAGRCFYWCGTHWCHDEGEVYRCASLVSLIVSEEMREWRAKVGTTVEETKLYRDIADALAKWSKKCEMKSTIDAAFGLLKKLLNVPVEQLDADPWALNCLNGTVDLRTSVIKAHEPKDRITRCLAVVYESTAKAVRFGRFLTEITADDTALQAFLRRWYGYCATGSVQEQAFVVAVGVGSNGKGALTAAIDSTLGAYAIPAPPNLLTWTGSATDNRHPTEIADLQGCRLVTSSETEDGAMLRESFVKKITGGDVLKARFMRGDFFEFRPTFKLQLLTNHLPQIRGTEYAIWRRTLIVRFPVRFGSADDIRDGRADQVRDNTLETTLRDERAGILTWIVAGAHEWYRDGLRPPGSVLLAVRQYQSDEDRINVFVSERCAVDPGAQVPLAALYGEYLAWSKSSGLTPQSRQRFLDELLRVVPGALRDTCTSGPRDQRRKHVVVKGLAVVGEFNETL